MATKYRKDSGEWMNSTWATISGGPYDKSFVNGDDAVFEGISDVTVNAANVIVNSIRFNTNGYTLTGHITLGANSPTAETGKIYVGAAISATIAAILVGESKLIKMGDGMLRITSDIDLYDGGIEVKTGTLLVNGNFTYGVYYTGCTTVSPGATLGGIGTIYGSVSSEQGILSPGDESNYSASTLTIINQQNPLPELIWGVKHPPETDNTEKFFEGRLPNSNAVDVYKMYTDGKTANPGISVQNPWGFAAQTIYYWEYPIPANPISPPNSRIGYNDNDWDGNTHDFYFGETGNRVYMKIQRHGYVSKVILTLRSVANGVNENTGTGGPDTPNTVIATYADISLDDMKNIGIKLEISTNQARIIMDSSPLIPVGGGSGWVYYTGQMFQSELLTPNQLWIQLDSNYIAADNEQKLVFSNQAYTDGVTYTRFRGNACAGQPALTLDYKTVLDYTLGSNSDKIVLLGDDGDLTLDGTINVRAGDNLSEGTYDLITYTGTLIDNGLTLGTMPSDYTGRIIVNTSDKIIQLEVTYDPVAEKDFLWKRGCDNTNMPYYKMKPMEINRFCMPFLSDEFPYDTDGDIIESLYSSHDYSGNEDYRFKKLIDPVQDIDFVVPNNLHGGKTGFNKDLCIFTPHMWKVYWNIRPAVSAMLNTDIPSKINRTGGVMADPVLNSMFSYPDLDNLLYAVPPYYDMSNIFDTDVIEETGEAPLIIKETGEAPCDIIEETGNP